MKKTPAAHRLPTPTTTQALKLFQQALVLGGLPQPEGFYQRLWTPSLTLWYFLWQWLQPKHTLQDVLTDARRGGADQLCAPDKRLSRGLKSRATPAYSAARKRLPLKWVRQCFSQLAAALLPAGHWRSLQWPVELLDGSTKRLRPYGDIGQHFPAHRTRRKHAYWCVARVVVSFCAATGIATAARIASLQISEQALAVDLILVEARRVLYVGDRNFGVWRVVRATVQGGGHALVRLTRVRARHLWGRKRLPAFLDQSVVWSASAHDQLDPGLEKEPVAGRLVLLKVHPRGFRPQTLYLFTTLMDRQAYPARRLLALYGGRWQVELNFRTVKSTMDMDQSEAKSADMVCKEFYVGLMAYNLVRALMASAARQSNGAPMKLSFAKVQGLLACTLTELFLRGTPAPVRQERLQWLLSEASWARLPRRRAPRPSEPRAQYYPPQTFPKLKGSRPQARRALKQATPKS